MKYYYLITTFHLPKRSRKFLENNSTFVIYLSLLLRRILTNDILLDRQQAASPVLNFIL